MWKTKCSLLFLFFVNFMFSQEKRTIDTVYVYEEIIIRDTVYIEKPLNKIKIDKIIVDPASLEKKSQITIFQNNEKTVLNVDSLEISNSKKSHQSRWNLGSKLHLGLISNTLMKEFNTQYQLNAGLGFFVKKSVFHSNFSIGTGFDLYFTLNPTQLNPSDSESFLNGYYFTDDGNPKLFQSISSKGFQFQIPLQCYWKIKKFTPSIGILGNLSSYQSKFEGSSGVLPLTLDETQTYSARAFYFGYLAQLEYSVTKNWSIGIHYSFANAHNIVFQRNQESFSVAKKMTQNNFGLNLFYHF